MQENLPGIGTLPIRIGRLSWHRRAGPSATLDKSSSVVADILPQVSRMGKRAALGAAGTRADPSGAELLQERLAPGLGGLGGIECVEVDTRHVRGGIERVRCDALEEGVRSIEAA